MLEVLLLDRGDQELAVGVKLLLGRRSSSAARAAGRTVLPSRGLSTRRARRTGRVRCILRRITGGLDDTC